MFLPHMLPLAAPDVPAFSPSSACLAFGAGPAPIIRRRLDVDRLGVTLVAATSDAALHHRANVSGNQIRAEDGVGGAARWIEHTVSAARL